MIFLQQVSILFLKKKKRISPILNTSTIRRKVIILASIPKKNSKKLLLVLLTSTLVSATKKEVSRNAETGETGEMIRIARMVKIGIKMRIWEQTLYESYVFNTLSPSKSNLCWHYLIQEIRLIPSI